MAEHRNDSNSTTTGGAAAPPRTVAVALTHDPAKPDLPKVVASGHGFVAEQILALAFAHGVKVREDADLAQMLALVDQDSDIPVEAMAAVAEILAYLYRANGTLAAPSPSPAPAPAPAPGGPP